MPLFFQHGLGGSAEKILALLELPRGYRLVSLDCRAHGETSPLGEVEELRFDVLADDVIALMDHLQIPRVVVGGTSMGAGVALNCAVRYPQRVLGLVLLRPAWLESPNSANLKIFGLISQLIRTQGTRIGLEAFRKTEAYGAMLKESSDCAESLTSLFLDPRAVETVGRLERIPRDTPSSNRADWRRITVPTLVLANRRDPIHPFEYGQELAREIPGARFKELTPKSQSLIQYTSELRGALAEFLAARFPANGTSQNDLC